ncbi:ABC transporter ATP-binding protein [Oricola sp.]|uniref:ABC transporter ATP-binding protein n=1 Tax=Oricola sp. TaxID=1979950 RepID=UPI003BAB3F6D
MSEVLRIEDLQVHFRTPRGVNRAVEGLSLHVDEAETLAIVGESGSGKSVASMSILKLLDPGIAGMRGSIRFQGRELTGLTEEEMRDIRGNAISMVFQEPMTALNPVMTVGRQIAEALTLHRDMSAREATEKAKEMLELVGIPEPESRVMEYPHQLSGGMRQRVMIAMALACEPRLLIADEPTTALDVTIQAQILDLMKSLRDRIGASIIIVTHDLGVVAEVADRVVVMYAGHKIEEADVRSLFRAPHHPYTVGLLSAMPKLGTSKTEKNWRLSEIPGQVPSTVGKLNGCVFAGRCHKARDECHQHKPALRDTGEGRLFACHFPENMEL